MSKNERGFIQHHFWLRNGASKGFIQHHFWLKSGERGLPSTIFHKNGAGFTLVELLVAMVITILLVAALFNVFNLAGRAWQKGEARTQKYQNLRQALDRMSDDIRGAILLNPDYNAGADRTPGTADDPDFRFYGCANRDYPEYGEELNFISVSYPPDDWKYKSDWTKTPPKVRFDCCEITYYMKPTDEPGEARLMRRCQNQIVPDDDVTKTPQAAGGGGTYSPFAERITHLNFSYYDENGVYSDLWNSSTKLPTRVRIELTAQADLAREQKEETFTTEVWLAHANFR